MNEYTVFSLISSSVFQMCFFYRFLFFVNSVNDKGVNTALGCVSYSYSEFSDLFQPSFNSNFEHFPWK